MMIEFYGGLLIILALALALLPFVRPESALRQNRAQTVRAIYRGRLDELEVGFRGLSPEVTPSNTESKESCA